MNPDSKPWKKPRLLLVVFVRIQENDGRLIFRNPFFAIQPLSKKQCYKRGCEGFPRLNSKTAR